MKNNNNKSPRAALTAAVLCSDRERAEIEMNDGDNREICTPSSVVALTAAGGLMTYPSLPLSPQVVVVVVRVIS